jgi:hypothetical protein
LEEDIAMTASDVIRKLALSRHREKCFAKWGLQDFSTSAIAAILTDIYLDGGKTMLIDLHYDGRKLRHVLVQMGMATIKPTDKKGTNHKILNEIILTPKGMAIAENAVAKIEKTMNKIQTA